MSRSSLKRHSMPRWRARCPAALPSVPVLLLLVASGVLWLSDRSAAFRATAVSPVALATARHLQPLQMARRIAWTGPSGSPLAARPAGTGNSGPLVAAASNKAEVDLAGEERPGAFGLRAQYQLLRRIINDNRRARGMPVAGQSQDRAGPALAQLLSNADRQEVSPAAEAEQEAHLLHTGYSQLKRSHSINGKEQEAEMQRVHLPTKLK